jgi:DNA ligase (NAD+)
MSEKEDIFYEINKLRKEIRENNYHFYALESPVISDKEYDKMMARLLKLENENPEFLTPDSPSIQRGSWGTF